MAEGNFTLTTFYTSWKAYQDHIKGALAPLKASQLEVRAPPHLRSIGENALHIIGCRAGWFIELLGEDCGIDVKEYASWDVSGAPARTPSETAHALDRTWPAGVPTTCTRLSLTAGLAHKLTYRAPGWSGM